MKKILLSLLFGLSFTTNFHTQIKPSGENLPTYLFEKVRFEPHVGMSFIPDPQLKAYFHAQSFFAYGLELRFERQKKSLVLPFFSFDRINYKSDSYNLDQKFYSTKNTINNSMVIDTILKINQFCIGFQTPLHRSEFNTFYSVLAYHVGEFRITDTEHNVTFSGLRMGLGLEHRICNKQLFAHSLELIYDLNKTLYSDRSNTFLNYNVLRVRYTLGF